METYKMIVEYDGTRYGGYKRNKKSSAATIMEKIEAVLLRMEQGQKFVLVAAVNTEEGVHSMGQTLSYVTEGKYKAEEILHYMNKYLPLDIVVREVTKEKEGFHAEFAKSGLLYQYRIQIGNYQKVMEQAYMSYEPEGVSVPMLREAIELLLGTREFAAFKKNQKIKKSGLRTIQSFTVEESKEEIRLSCVIDDVWPGLMPAIFGSLIELGKKRLSLKEFQDRLQEAQPGTLYLPAPAKGLLLLQVRYDLKP